MTSPDKAENPEDKNNAEPGSSRSIPEVASRPPFGARPVSAASSFEDTKKRLKEREESLIKTDAALRKARETIADLQEENESLKRTPNNFGVALKKNMEDRTVDIFTGGRKVRVACDSEVFESLQQGQEVLLNDSSLGVIGVAESEFTGEVVSLKEVLDENTRALVLCRGDEEKVLELSTDLRQVPLHAGDSLLANMRTNILLERLPRPEVEELMLDEVPDVNYEDIGGLNTQIEMITDAVELPFLNPELFEEHKLQASKGVLLYGPPGCGKTLIAKAVANSLAGKVPNPEKGKKPKSYFFNVKGPELLNKYVGETERQIRLIFQRARERSAEGWPVVIFFDEMESLFRMRGSGISSDVESTIVPQLLAEIDGVETLRNVIVIGASNREDLIDPAILRPGRLDVKIKVERPTAEAAQEIFARYLESDIPIAETEIEHLGGGDPEKAVRSMIEKTVEALYAEERQNQFLEVTYQNGDKQTMYFKDFTSGAMIANIVRRAKKLAIKRHLEGEEKGVCLNDMLTAVSQEFKEHEDLPNTTNPDDWAKISGKKGEPIIFVRTLLHNDDSLPFGGRSIEQVSSTGQYL